MNGKTMQDFVLGRILPILVTVFIALAGWAWGRVSNVENKLNNAEETINEMKLGYTKELTELHMTIDALRDEITELKEDIKYIKREVANEKRR